MSYPEYTSQSFLSAYKKGYLQGLKPDYYIVTKSPYKDKRTWRGQVTFSRAFSKFWWDGYFDAVENRVTFRLWEKVSTGLSSYLNYVRPCSLPTNHSLIGFFP